MKIQFILFSLCLLLIACGGNEGKTTENKPSTNDSSSTNNSTISTIDNNEETNLVENEIQPSEPLDVPKEDPNKKQPAPKKDIKPFSSTNETNYNDMNGDQGYKEEPIKVVENTNNNTPTKVNPPVKSNTETKNTKPLPLELSHDDWHRMMSTYVNSAGQVNYAGLKREKSKIDAYLTQLGTHPPQNGWSRNKEMAYWINFYNAFTISLILEKYPNINSIMELDGGKVWTTRTMLVAGKAFTLEQMEKDMLLKKFNEPRVHFAVVCAAKSCPPLLNAAWTEDNIQKNFEVRAKKFINNPAFNDIKTNSLELSKIFEWYAADFGNVIDYLSKYSETRIDKGPKIKYKEYDWGLNKQ